MTSAMQPCLFLEDRIASRGYIAIIAESFRPQYPVIRPMLTSLAEPISRPSLMHTYQLTPFSLGTAVSNGVSVDDVMAFFRENSYGLALAHSHTTLIDTTLYATLRDFVSACMSRYNQVRIVIENERTMVQCRSDEVAEALLSDAVIRSGVAAPSKDAAATTTTSALLQHEVFTWGETRGSYAYFLLQNRPMAKIVASRCVLLGYPIQQQYDYEKDPAVRTAYFSLRSQTKPRNYQIEAVEAATSDGTLFSGCLLLPCGAGKTLVGIMLMCKVRKPTLVVCAGAVSVEQWKNQILECASLDPLPADSETLFDATHGPPSQQQQRHAGRGRQAVMRSGAARIACLTGKQKDDITDDTDVVLTTYSMLVTAYKAVLRRQAQGGSTIGSQGRSGGAASAAARKRKPNPKEKLFSPYGLLILDEVHVIPAEAFRESLGFIDAKGVIGLTATYVREDSRIMDLFHLVGPKLYDVSMETLVAQGYLAKVNCIEVHTPMTREFGLEYLERSAHVTQKGNSINSTGHVPALVLLAAANPYKMQCVQELVARHLEDGAKILVFCDHILLLHEYGKLLRAPVICGATPHRERLMIFSDFQSTAKVNLICISRVGDVSVNLPSASVVIQVSSHGGSRRQEAQRLGRILRPKDRAANGKTVEAWFYSIISMDTLEMAHAAHRTAFLVDQGYACRMMEFVPHDTDAATTTTTSSNSMKSETKPAEATTQSPAVVKTAVVGDTVSIKQEAMQGELGRTTLHRRHTYTNTSGAASLSDGEDMRSLSYQLRLLSRVVSSWEMDFQQASRARKAGEEDDDDDEDISRSTEAGEEDEEDADVVVVPAPRTLRTVKQEWAGRGSEEQSGITSSGGMHRGGTTAAVSLNELVGVEDGFVYHEL